MPPRQLHVVGDPFAHFAAQSGSLTVPRVLAGLRSGGLAPDAPVRLVSGLGVTRDDWAAVEHAAAAAADVDAEPYRTPRLAAEGLCKRDPRNVLIADLRRTADRLWRADLVVHPEGAPFTDHDNGTGHVPGMVEVEAGLQMAMGVTEGYLLPHPGDFVFVTSGVDIRFPAFLFPLAAAVELRADRTEWPRPDLLEIELTARIIQGTETTMTMRFHSRAYRRDLFDPVETERAAAAAATTLEYR
jgi:hypothetical protein